MVRAVHELYVTLYRLSAKIGKRDRFGIYLKVEMVCLEVFTLSIETAFASSGAKVRPLETIRIKTEILKHLIRICCELSIITDMQYITIQERLQEISKMATGWLKYATTPRS